MKNVAKLFPVWETIFPSLTDLQQLLVLHKNFLHVLMRKLAHVREASLRLSNPS